MARHQLDRLVVSDLPLPQTQLGEDGFACTEQVAGRHPRLAHQLAQLVLGEREDVEVDRVEVDAVLLSSEAANGTWCTCASRRR